MDPHTFSEGHWTLQAYINSLQSPSQKVCGSIGIAITDFCTAKPGEMKASLRIRVCRAAFGTGSEEGSHFQGGCGQKSRGGAGEAISKTQMLIRALYSADVRGEAHIITTLCQSKV